MPVVVGRGGLTCEAPTTDVGDAPQSSGKRCHVYRSMEHAYPSCMLPPRDEPNAVATPDGTDERAAGLYYPEVTESPFR